MTSDFSINLQPYKHSMEWIVTKKESGTKLLLFLTQHLDGKYSSKFIKRTIEHNGCQINGRMERFASTILGNGDHVTLLIEQAPPPGILQEELQRILFEDEALLVYDKPAGVNCDEKGILKILKKRNPSLQLVHRLDRDTTGVLLLAKTPQIFERLVEQFKQFHVQKRYLAIVDGVLLQSVGMIENYLGKRSDYAGQTLWGSVNSSKGLAATTEWHCRKRGKQATLVECMPKTGRTHQIRVHMAEMGHPILGDYQYGKEFKCLYRPVRILLHAEELCFHHPVSGQLLELKAPLPEDFKQAQQDLFKG